MAQQTIGVGSAPNDTTGDPLRTAFIKCNDNFTDLYGNKAALASPTFTGNPQAPTPAAGDNDTSIATTAFVQNAAGPQHGRLVRNSATQLAFVPYGGDQLKIQGVVYTIPSGGITSGLTGVLLNGSTGNLVAGITYLVCAYNNAGTPALGFYTTLSHTQDTTAGNVGVEIATGNPNLSVVGMVFINNSTQFEDSTAWRGVCSWFNRRNKVLGGAGTGGQTSTSSTVAEILTSARAYFCAWAEDELYAGVTGGIYSTGGSGSIASQLGVDGAVVGYPVFQTLGNANWWAPGSGTYVAQLSDGTHYITPMGAGFGLAQQFHVFANGLVRG